MTNFLVTVFKRAISTSALISLGLSSANAIELPLFKKEAEERGYTLPEAVGLSLGYMNVSQNINIDSIQFENLKVLGFPIASKDLSIETEGGYQDTSVLTLKADAWLLPFLNVYVIGGKLNGYSETTIKSISYKGLNLSNEDIPFRLDLDGYLYGTGTVIAGGYENIFALVDASYTKTKLTVIDGEIDSIVVSPRIGYDFSRNTDLKLRAWVGAQYQNIEQTLTGNIKDLPFAGDLPNWLINDGAKFRVEQTLANNWNTLVGAQYEFTPNLVLISEMGLGQRKSFFVTLDARF
ncbi:TonB-dependent receptor [Vibrio sp. McD22-P3]|uniref:TonB-dependent receptor n=1 Tax=Vibrio sp. McD22-P3 TaxID=2724880 RepID=UPI001F402287|nr:TonB-dependent receptor [Vibrio sp. McD22-P3]MCF4172507.1 TonB-dependent receptor [Vibrio sp. McD22-P3]